MCVSVRATERKTDPYRLHSPHQQVGPQPLIQIFLFCGFLEFQLHQGKLTQADMFKDGKREPGASSFPLIEYYVDPNQKLHSTHRLSAIANPNRPPPP